MEFLMFLQCIDRKRWAINSKRNETEWKKKFETRLKLTKTENPDEFHSKAKKKVIFVHMAMLTIITILGIEYYSYLFMASFKPKKFGKYVQMFMAQDTENMDWVSMRFQFRFSHLVCVGSWNWECCWCLLIWYSNRFISCEKQKSGIDGIKMTETEKVEMNQIEKNTHWTTLRFKIHSGKRVFQWCRKRKRNIFHWQISG